MPHGNLFGIKSGMLASGQKIGLQDSTKLESFVLADPVIDEDTYQLFVNQNDDAISTQKALNSRLEKLSSSQSQERKDQGTGQCEGSPANDIKNFGTAKFPNFKQRASAPIKFTSFETKDEAHEHFSLNNNKEKNNRDDSVVFTKNASQQQTSSGMRQT